MIAGCAMDWTDQPIAFGQDYAADIQPLWNAWCADCHVQHGGAPAAGLDLEAPWSWYNLQDAARLRPGDPWRSLLFLKLDCQLPPQGNAMPLGRPPLPAAVRARLYDWIRAGARQDDPTLFAHGFEARAQASPE